MPPDLIPFSRPYRAGFEHEAVASALAGDVWQGDGIWTARASALLEALTGASKALLTTSCTHALELSAMLLNLGPGDEVLVPSYTFPSTAAAVAVRGAVPVFVDVRNDTLNLDAERAREAITPRTRAIFLVHYAGVSADVDGLGGIAEEHGLSVIEDNAHGLGASWRGRPLGSFGRLATQSFHATKNVTCGEGGALLVNDASLEERAEIIREKGMNRSAFLRGHVDKYTWVDIGSSYLPSDLLAAMLTAQLQYFGHIQTLRRRVWDVYSSHLQEWAERECVELMHVPDGASHPAHMFYMLMPRAEHQIGMLQHLRSDGIVGTFHYQPLHASPAGRRFGRAHGACPVSVDAASRIVRLPLFAGMSSEEVERVTDSVLSFSTSSASRTDR